MFICIWFQVFHNNHQPAPWERFHSIKEWRNTFIRAASMGIHAVLPSELDKEEIAISRDSSKEYERRDIQASLIIKVNLVHLEGVKILVWDGLFVGVGLVCGFGWRE